MAKKGVVPKIYMDEPGVAVATVEPEALSEHFSNLPFLQYKIIFTYLEDFQLTGDRRQEEVMYAKDAQLAQYAATRGITQGLNILRDDEILWIPAHRVLQARVLKNG